MTNDEATALLLLNECKTTQFYKYDCTTSEAKAFVSLVGTPEFNGTEDVQWYSATNGKIRATAFLKESEYSYVTQDNNT
ncbi:hypothetical protein [Listeria booriae]|uniref:hypothetical protein n=1 Tax=Listeria booriae TaxID=1552123 RepID=UPI0016242D7A|nr:hypothetical protein [Listeria booriae]MBC1233652.1 hypothetical protein [Listeria booriae]